MIAALPTWVKGIPVLLLLLFLGSAVQAQERVISGKITDTKDGAPLVGATISIKGTLKGVTTGPDGFFKITVPADAKTLVISSVGFGTRELDIAGKADGAILDLSLTSVDASLNEIVVVGYGTARKKDLTGSVATVKEKDFNQGILSAPDQLIQGKVAGVQVLNNSGQPGGQTSVRIRGTSSIRSGNQPLYVVDGVPLDGRSARPGTSSTGLGSTTPDANPLNFINPNDIASMDVLKDASATAIYGSRGANGVILITTKRGKSGAPRLDAGVSVGVSDILKKLDVLSAGRYREALSEYGVTGSDWGSNVDALDAITRKGIFQNYNVSASGGNENARLRLSLGYYNQDGVVRKSGLKKYSANLSGNFKFLESKKLGLDINIITSQIIEKIAPITTDAGFEGNLISQALQWNPTRALRNGDGSLNIKGDHDGFPATAYNPLAYSEAYDDEAKITGILASISPYYKITDHLEYRMLLSVNYGTGVRKAQLASFMNIPGIEGNGIAVVGNNELVTRQVTHTLNYNKQLTKALFLGATLGYEYMKFDHKGFSASAQGFSSTAIPYTSYMQGARIQNGAVSFADPTAELQSVFGRANFNLWDRFLLTATLRADGSNKFGKNNKYGYFPSLAAAWNITNEEFLKGNTTINSLKLRAGWGITGNQEFPSGAAQAIYAYTGPGEIKQVNVANPDLKWETSTTINFGLDYSLIGNRLYGSLEYFNKTTQDLLFNFDAIPPAPASRYWINLPGNVLNAGFEATINGLIIDKKDIQWNLGVYASFLKNELRDYNGPTILTGEISGQGLTGAYSQRMESGQPLNAFYMGKFLNIDKDGKAVFEGGDPNENRFFVGDPNPKTLLGVSTTVTYKKFSLNVNLNGAFGHKIYNNTTQAALAIGNIKGNRNIAAKVYNPGALEDAGSSQPVSTRYLEKGDYLKLSNMTLGYGIGRIGRPISNAYIYLTGQNLLVFTNYSGFDPEVNTPKPINGVPSFGIEYAPYPSVRNFIIGINFTL